MSADRLFTVGSVTHALQVGEPYTRMLLVQSGANLDPGKVDPDEPIMRADVLRLVGYLPEKFGHSLAELLRPVVGCK